MGSVGRSHASDTRSGIDSLADICNDSFDIGGCDAMIPDVVWEHHHVGAFGAEILAAGFAHAHGVRETQRFHAILESRGDGRTLPVRAADVPRFALIDAHKHDFLVRDAGLLHDPLAIRC